MVARSDSTLEFGKDFQYPGFWVQDRNYENGASLSGSERNHLFVNAGGGKRFVDVSPLSGADHDGDGRVFALLDFDRDGGLDLAVTNANAPLFQLFRNSWSTRNNDAKEPAVVAFRFVGGNTSAAPNSTLSARDGYGAKITFELYGSPLVREHRAGEGFAAQNSSTMLIGIGEAKTVGPVTIEWPSGRTQSIDSVPRNTLVTVCENAEACGNQSGTKISVYKTEGFTEKPTSQPMLEANASAVLDTTLASSEVKEVKSELRVLTTFATWCSSCIGELPAIAELVSRFESTEVAFYGVPIDANDTDEKIDEWRETFEPAYEVLSSLAPAERQRISRYTEQTLGADLLPVTLIVDRKGALLWSDFGIPTVSDLKKLLSN